jgi:outer membrane protein assembly factor BamA
VISFKKYLSIVLLVLICSFSVYGESAENNEQEKSDDVLWTVVPGPFYNPNVGTGVLVMPMVVYPFNSDDDISPPSSTMLALLITKPDWSQKGATIVGGINQSLYLKEDTWRISGFVGGGTVLYRFYVPGNDTDNENSYAWIRNDGIWGNVTGLRKIIPNLYGGLLYTYQAFSMYGEKQSDQEFLNAIGISDDWQFVSVMGAKFLYDSRDNQYSPWSGINTELVGEYGAKWLGGSTDYGAVSLSYAQYASVSKSNKHILAWQARVRTGIGDVPPNEMSAVGSDRSGYRGYMGGEYKDKSVFESQVEIRSMLTERMGMVGFLGLGTTFPDITEFGQSSWLPAGGFGLRFAAIPEERINARLDFAWGIDSFAMYFSLGEAF